MRNGEIYLLVLSCDDGDGDENADAYPFPPEDVDDIVASAGAAPPFVTSAPAERGVIGAAGNPGPDNVCVSPVTDAHCCCRCNC